jgi:glycosyltransferase involved in cell wall biosynthesis
MAEPTPDLSIVLPAHNEAENIAPIAAALKEHLGPLGSHEIIFVDDGSTDATLPAIRAVAMRDPTVRFVALTRNFGQEAALRAGLRHARGRAVVVMDADFEHPPERIADLVKEWRAGFKVVAAQRLDDDSTALAKRMTSRLYYRLLGVIGDVRLDVGSADFLLLDRTVVDVLNRLEEHDLFLRGVVRWLGYPIAQVRYRPGQRQHGTSKYTWRHMVELAITGIAAHSVRPLRFAVWLSLGFALAGLLLLVYAVVSFLFVQHTVAGWSSVMAAIAILGAAQFLVLGVIGEYLGRVLRETRRRPSYVIAETEADTRPGASAKPVLPPD